MRRCKAGSAGPACTAFGLFREVRLHLDVGVRGHGARRGVAAADASRRARQRAAAGLGHRQRESAAAAAATDTMRQPQCSATKPLTTRESTMPSSSPVITAPTTRPAGPAGRPAARRRAACLRAVAPGRAAGRLPAPAPGRVGRVAAARPHTGFRGRRHRLRDPRRRGQRARPGGDCALGRAAHRGCGAVAGVPGLPARTLLPGAAAPLRRFHEDRGAGGHPPLLSACRVPARRPGARARQHPARASRGSRGSRPPGRPGGRWAPARWPDRPGRAR